MKLTEVYNDPAIIDIDIPELADADLDSYFNMPTKKNDYGNLIVEDGRLTIIHHGNLAEHKNLVNIMTKPIYEITKKLLSMDLIRYPLFEEFDVFYKKEVQRHEKFQVLGTVDQKGFSQPWHLDNRFIMISGSINVQDNVTSTYFAKENNHWLEGGTTFDHCDLIYTGRKTKFTGTAWINTEHTWHCVPQITEENRKTLLFNVFL